MGSMSIWHWVIVLIVVGLVFGTKKLRNMGEDLGMAIKGFKEGLKQADDVESKPQAQLENNLEKKSENIENKIENKIENIDKK